MWPALKPSSHFLPPPPSLWAASWPGALASPELHQSPTAGRSVMLGTAFGPHLQFQRQCWPEPFRAAEHTGVVCLPCTSARRLLLALQTGAKEKQPGHQPCQQRHLPCAVSEHNDVAASALDVRCFPAPTYCSSERFSSDDSCQLPPRVQVASSKPLLGNPDLSTHELGESSTQESH